MAVTQHILYDMCTLGLDIKQADYNESWTKKWSRNS